MDFNIALCNRSQRSPDEIPFGAPHRLYLPPRQMSKSFTLKEAHHVGAIPKHILDDPALSIARRPRASSENIVQAEVKSHGKPRANSLGEIWERLFKSKGKTSKKKKKIRDIARHYLCSHRCK